MDSGPDKYNRTLAKVIHNQEILNQILIENGLAWVYDNYCLETFCTEWQALETQARDGSRGLWSESSPQAPWDYRHTNP
jgi:endonuclease YncB( thermonuclease family)